MSETNNTVGSRIKTMFSPIANLQSIKEIGTSASKNFASFKRGMSNTQSRLQQMFSFNVSGPFSELIGSCIIMYILYYFITKALVRMESTNPVLFIRKCVDIWFYIILVMIIYAFIIKFL